MEKYLKTGLGFGLTSGIITTLGLMVGLYSGTNSKLAVIGGILTIAISDAFSDALGIHISKEFEDKYSIKDIWKSTFFTFIFKFIFATIFVFPVLLFNLYFAIIANIALGFLLIAIFSWSIAGKNNHIKVVSEHLAIAILVVIISNFTGAWIKSFFGNLI